MIQCTMKQALAALAAYAGYKPTGSNLLHKLRLAHIPVVLNEDELAFCLDFTNSVLRVGGLDGVQDSWAGLEPRLQIACLLFVTECWAEASSIFVLDAASDTGCYNILNQAGYDFAFLAIRNAVGRDRQDHNGRNGCFLSRHSKAGSWKLDTWMPIFLAVRTRIHQEGLDHKRRESGYVRA